MSSFIDYIASSIRALSADDIFGDIFTTQTQQYNNTTNNDDAVINDTNMSATNDTLPSITKSTDLESMKESCVYNSSNDDDSDGEQYDLSIDGSTVIGHAEQQALLWSDGLKHAPGATDDICTNHICDRARNIASNQLLHILCNMYVCNNCNNHFNNVHKCCQYGLGHSIVKYTNITITLIDIILSYCILNVSDTWLNTVHHTIEFNRLIQCICMKNIDSNVYELYMQVEQCELVQLLRSRLFIFDRTKSDTTHKRCNNNIPSIQFSKLGYKLLSQLKSRYHHNIIDHVLYKLYQNTNILLLQSEYKSNIKQLTSTKVYINTNSKIQLAYIESNFSATQFTLRYMTQPYNNTISSSSSSSSAVVQPNSLYDMIHDSTIKFEHFEKSGGMLLLYTIWLILYTECII